MNQFEAEILYFFGWWQLSVCSFAFLSLLAIWWHIGKKKGDFGQVWLALSVLCWSLSGLTEIIFATSVHYKQGHLEVFRSLFSLFNSLFILLALPWFKYLPSRIESVIKSKYWYAIIGLPFIFSILPTLSKIWLFRTYNMVSEPDVYFAFLTLLFLGSVLWTSFKKRQLVLLAYLSLVSIGITFIAQLYKLTDADINLTLFSAIFKTSLIMIFFALALSWVKELSENVIPHPSLMGLRLFYERKNPDKVIYYAVITGIPGIKPRPITLTNSNYNLLNKFAHRRKMVRDGWLEIKPKENTRDKKLYDIHDHNQIKRLIVSLLNGLFGPESWTKEQHYFPLKESLFESSDNRERKIRIRLAKENISLESP